MNEPLESSGIRRQAKNFSRSVARTRDEREFERQEADREFDREFALPPWWAIFRRLRRFREICKELRNRDYL